MALPPGQLFYMNPDGFRSAPNSSLRYPSGPRRDPNRPQFVMQASYEGNARSDYRNGDFDRSYGRAVGYDRDIYSRGEDYRYNWEDIRRMNSEVENANASITPISNRARVYPKMTSNGRYPTGFSEPMRLDDIMNMSESELHYILATYDSDSSNREDGPFARRYARPEQSYNSFRSERGENLIVLFDFLGAYQVSGALEDRLRRR